MGDYFWVNSQVGFSDAGIHLLRNRYCYRRIGFAQVARVEIGLGKGVRRWVLVLAMGLVLALGGLGMLYASLSIMRSGPTLRQAYFSGYLLMAVLLSCGLGYNAIMGALRKVPVMVVHTADMRYAMPLEGLAGDIDALVDFLQKNKVLVARTEKLGT